MEFTTLELRPYFEVPAENLEAFKDIWKAKMDAIKEGEPKNVFYGFSFNGTIATCREGYTDADGLIFHLGHVNEALTKV